MNFDFLVSERTILISNTCLVTFVDYFHVIWKWLNHRQSYQIFILFYIQGLSFVAVYQIVFVYCFYKLDCLVYLAWDLLYFYLNIRHGLCSLLKSVWWHNIAYTGWICLISNHKKYFRFKCPKRNIAISSAKFDLR